IIRALAHTGGGVRLVIVGQGPQQPQLAALAASLALDPRVTWTGAIDDDRLADLYAGALAVVFPPYDEDYGYITLEAMLARKPVVTTTDSGGPLEFVEDGVTGLVAAPEPEALGAAIARLAGDRRLAAS